MARIVLLALLIFPLSLNAKEIEIFYNGFGFHSPFPTSLEMLRDNHLLYVCVTQDSIPENISTIIFDGYTENTEYSLGIEYVFYLKKVDGDGNIVSEIGAGNHIMFDLKNNGFKRLSENEKALINNYIKDTSSIESDFILYLEIENQ